VRVVFRVYILPLKIIDFGGGGIHRVEFINCKLVGANFDECNLRDVLFQNVLAKYSNFSFAKFKRINFDRCDFLLTKKSRKYTSLKGRKR
jgi:uncharacterized protein YjbI with pentapeptide repeats